MKSICIFFDANIKEQEIQNLVHIVETTLEHYGIHEPRVDLTVGETDVDANPETGKK